MAELKPGQLVRSLAGRDKNKHYLVLKEIEQNYVLLVNGRSKPVARPKKKNKAHLQHYERRADLGDMTDPESMDDNQIAKYLKEVVPVAGSPEEEV
ncbi:MAG: KOW domain-containing RNA-binding protein [Bacillota bacterium]|nr:KOW domain-containing RNA-binding protein [Bacillota bacterium]